MDSVITHVPATTANLGPGYDCLGIALMLGNRVTVSRTEAPVELPPIVEKAAEAFFAAADLARFPFSWSIEGEVPQSRGLGSSVTVRLGVLSGLNALAGNPLTREQLFGLCARLEGHPDNAAPAAFGGFTVAGGENISRFEVSLALEFVLLIPDFEVATPDARRVLPATLDRLAAVASAANACRITAAFATQDYEKLRGAFTDHFHQPHRLPLIPFLNDVITAGENAGAIGGFLSGSGSTICCVTLKNSDEVAMAMLAASGQKGARTIITQADNGGMKIKS